MKTKAKIFLSYARVDRAKVVKLWHRLKAEGFTPWMDTKTLVGGTNWQQEIKKAIRSADFFLVCLTPNSIGKRGYVQAEIKQALDVLNEFPEDQIYLIPVRMEECQLPDGLSEINCVDLFAKGGWHLLLDSLQEGLRRRTPKAI